MKIYTEDGSCYETIEEIVFSHIAEGYEDEHISHELSFTDIDGEYICLFPSEIVKIAP